MIAGRKTGPVLALAFCAAGFAVAWFVYSGLEAPADLRSSAVVAGEQPPAGAGALPPVQVFKLPPLKTFEATLERPVLSRSRRPKAGAQVVVSQNLALKMKGVSGSDPNRRALVVPEGGGESLHLREGEEYQGWTVNEIGDEHMIFRRDEEQVRLDMDFREQPKPVRMRPGQAGARQLPGAQGRQGNAAQKRQNQLQKQRQQQRRLQQQRQQNQQQRQNQQQQQNQQIQQQQQNQLEQNQLQQNLQNQ